MLRIQQLLEQERSLSQLKSLPLSHFLYTKEQYEQIQDLLEQGPTLLYTPNIFNLSRTDIIKDAYRYLPVIYNYSVAKAKDGVAPDPINLHAFLANPHQLVGAAHFGMFVKYIDLMGSQEHKKLYYQKALNCQITGCYAQTEVGHGSDIRSLETTATYDETTHEWIIDSPTASSAKYWPGEISFFANHAMVFAQTWVKGVNHGVNPFLVPIKDKEFNWLPGVEGGDIGPKIGFHAKENGYLYFRTVRIPKNNLFTKYAEISAAGEFRQVGDPRIGYGTMMYVREIIMDMCPKVLAQAAIIAGRYSFFRKQGVGADKKQMNILAYQTQQEKILPRIAEYYALTVAGTSIRKLSQSNREKVLKEDFSLLQETHSNLAFSKCLFSQICQDGIQILRRSMGGHGTSYYSGMPQLLNEYAANNTHQGENTVMYLQTAKYVLKSYRGFVTKGKKLPYSVQYMAKLQELQEKKLSGNDRWSIEELRDVVVRGIGHVVQQIGQRMIAKQPGETEASIINYEVGIKLQQMAQLHGVHFIIQEFNLALQKEKEESIKPLLTELCKLFAIGQIQRLAQPIIETGCVSSQKWAMLDIDKQNALKSIRPHTAILIDSFGIPDKYIRSEVVKGDPYSNFLNRARQCQINTSVTQSAFEVAKVKKILAAKPRL